MRYRPKKIWDAANQFDEDNSRKDLLDFVFQAAQSAPRFSRNQAVVALGGLAGRHKLDDKYLRVIYQGVDSPDMFTRLASLEAIRSLESENLPPDIQNKLITILERGRGNGGTGSDDWAIFAIFCFIPVERIQQRERLTAVIQLCLDESTMIREYEELLSIQKHLKMANTPTNEQQPQDR